MPESSPRRLPRGRSALPREEVERIQRARLCAAMAEVMAEKGYAATSVGDVLRRSGVSRQSFYQVFASKLDCFMATFERAGDLLTRRVLEVAGPAAGGGPLSRFERALTAYLDALATELPYARLFLVEVYAAGPTAIRRRGELQAATSALLADLMGVTTEQGRFTCRMIVAAAGTLVTRAATDNDPGALHAVGPPLMDHVRILWKAGAFGPVVSGPAPEPPE